MQVENSSLFLPWYNFNLIEYLNSYLKSNMVIFEYGIGFSSLFYAQKNCNVYGIETRIEWLERVQSLAKKHNLEGKIAISHCQDIPNFHKSLLNFNIDFDVIVIDSIQRLACLEIAKQKYQKGLIVLDNSERPNLKEAKNIMHGFNFLEFEGKRPNDDKTSSALVFFK